MGAAGRDCLRQGLPDSRAGSESASCRDRPAESLFEVCRCAQVMLLETSRRYNPGSESITFLKDFSYNREDFAKAGEN